MPAKTQHLQAAEENLRFSQTLSIRTASPAWAVTALFYSALHYMDAYLATRGSAGGVHPSSHVARNALVSSDPVLALVYLPYRRLKDRSEDTRYRLIPVTVTEVERLEHTELAAIRNLLTPLI